MSCWVAPVAPGKCPPGTGLQAADTAREAVPGTAMRSLVISKTSASFTMLTSGAGPLRHRAVGKSSKAVRTVQPAKTAGRMRRPLTEAVDPRLQTTPIGAGGPRIDGSSLRSRHVLGLLICDGGRRGCGAGGRKRDCRPRRRLDAGRAVYSRVAPGSRAKILAAPPARQNTAGSWRSLRYVPTMREPCCQKTSAAAGGRAENPLRRRRPGVPRGSPCRIAGGGAPVSAAACRLHRENRSRRQPQLPDTGQRHLHRHNPELVAGGRGIKGLAGEEHRKARCCPEDAGYLLDWNGAIDHSEVIVDRRSG
jgi:hypothetical protein